MNHWLIMPIVLPLISGALLLMLSSKSMLVRRLVSGVSLALLLITALRLFMLARDGTVEAYLIGDWPAPFGIVLVLDRLAALMVLLTTLLAVGAWWRAVQDFDRRGRQFHALFHFQLLGINGAFLTGDLFNLFVFFEILLIASYCLLLYGGGPKRARAGLHYVVLNLVGSSLFLFAVGLLYGVTGTLNMADLALTLRDLDAEAVPLAQAGGLLLLVVFALKAALPPLHFWLAPAYAAATAPIAALFAIMTKVGAYAMLRLFTLVFGADAGPLADLADPWLLLGALAAMGVGVLGVLAAEELRELTGYLIVVSVGTLLAGVSIATAAGIGGALYYLVHTTFVTGGLFLLADAIDRSRPLGSRLIAGCPPAGLRLLASLFFIAAVAIAGMPPLSGLIGKLLVLSAAQSDPRVFWIWLGVLGSSLFLIIGLSRAGGRLFWHGSPDSRIAPVPFSKLLPTVYLLSAAPLLVVFGGPVSHYTESVGLQLLKTDAYIEAVMATLPIGAGRLPEALP